MSIIPGRHKDRIAVYSEIETTNEYNEKEKSYQLAFHDRAEISFVSGSEKMVGQMSYADKVMKFKVRFRLSTYNERQHILWRGDYYNVRSIDPDRNRAYMIITGERVPTDTITITT